MVMSEKNAEVVRRGIEAFNRGEVEELLLYANPEIELNDDRRCGAERV